MTFLIYPKTGPSLAVEFRKFELTGTAFSLYEGRDQGPTDSIFINFDNVAAIVPMTQPSADSRFRVHLENKASFEVTADLFKIGEGAIRFYRRTYGQSEEEIGNLYVALTEVIAVVRV